LLAAVAAALLAALAVGALAGGTAFTAVGGGALTTGAIFGRGADSSSLRCWIAFSTSPGFDTFDQSIFGFASAAAAAFAVPL
jgi:hypothetical protein